MQYFSNSIEQIKSDYIKKIKEKISLCDEVYIYGAKIYGKSVYAFFCQNDIRINGFCVTSKVCNQEKICGYKLHTLDETLSFNKKILYVIAAQSHTAKAMIDELNKRNIISYIEPPPHNDEIFDYFFDKPVLEITPKVGCSVNCQYCPQKNFLSAYFKDNKKSEMSFDDFKFFIHLE